MKRVPIFTSSNFYDYLRYLRANDILAPERDYKKMAEDFRKNNPMLNLIPAVVYILDYSRQQHFFISDEAKRITGYSSDELMAMGLKAVHGIMVKDDLDYFSNNLFMNLYNFVHKIPTEDLHKYRFSLNYRVNRKDGAVIHLLQQYLILECDPMGYPLVTLGICSDITAHALNNQVVLTVSKFDDEEGYKLISSDAIREQPVEISSREIEVLKLISKGFSSGDIAKALSIKENTVRAHRRSLMRKTKCTKAPNLIKYALQHGLI